MKKSNNEERLTKNRFFKSVRYAGMLFLALFALVVTSCGGDDNDDPEPVPDAPQTTNGLVGTWSLTETASDETGSGSLTMTLTFNADNTGSIVEDWYITSRASSRETYSMSFSWSVTSDSNGNDILRISYVSGDKNTEIFPGSSTTVLWTRQYVLTGNILNIYGGSGVWVFNRR